MTVTSGNDKGKNRKVSDSVVRPLYMIDLQSFELTVPRLTL